MAEQPSPPGKPKWLDSGDNAWQMTAATIVGMQSVPGLVILYGSIVKKKWAVNSAFMALYAFAAVLVSWALFAFDLSFNPTDALIQHFWGMPSFKSLGQHFLFEEAVSITTGFPNATFVFFQFVFAAITLILIAGSLLGRMNFYAWMLFVPLWLIFSYTIGAYTMWVGFFHNLRSGVPLLLEITGAKLAMSIRTANNMEILEMIREGEKVGRRYQLPYG